MKKLLIALFILLAITLRFFWLDKVPNAIGGDELTYVITAKAIAINGTDVLGKWNPLSIFAFQYPFGEGQAELEYYLLYPFVLTSFSFFKAKFIFTLLSVLSVGLIYLITKKLLNEKTAIIAGFISAINPWLIFIGRTGYEVTPALFFALLSFYILLIAKNWKILLSIPFLLCLFYSYIGVKLIFIPFLLVILLYVYFYQNKKKYLKQYLIVLIACLALVLFFIVSLRINPGSSRMGELFTVNDVEIAKQVNDTRRLTIQTPITSLLENKYTVYGEIAAVKIFNIFSSDYLFNYADQFTGIGKHGLFYYIDALFLLLGIIFLASKSKKILALFLILVFISALPHVFHKVRTDNFTPHIFLIFPFLIMLISYGISESISFWEKSYLNKITLALIVVVYAVLLLNFLNIYLFQYPLKGNSDFQVRVLSKYASLADKLNKEVVVYTNRSYDLFKKYLFYSNNYNSKSFSSVQSAVVNRDYVSDHVRFTDCDPTIDFSKQKELAIVDSQCVTLSTAQYIVIPLLADGGERFRIYNDSICGEFSLKSYPSGLKINDFDIEKLSIQDFCQAFITRF